MSRTLIAIAAVLIGAAPAAAVEITNQDGAAQTIEITIGDEVMSATLAPGETRSDLCAGGCDLSVGDSALEDLEGGESVVIQNGKVEITG